MNGKCKTYAYSKVSVLVNEVNGGGWLFVGKQDVGSVSLIV